MYQKRDDDDGGGHNANGEESEPQQHKVKMTFVGKFVPVKWKCRAPMRNGKLCPRMDRFKCPLHGRVVARDETGAVQNEADRLEIEARESTRKKREAEEKPWLDQELIADINAAAAAAVSSNTRGNLIQTSEEQKKKRSRGKGGDNKRILARVGIE